MEDESIFDEADVTKELPTIEDASFEEDTTEELWAPTIMDESPKERLERKGLKEEADGRIVTIKEIFHTRPRTIGQDGASLPPKDSASGEGQYYTGKLGIRFEEDNLIEYYPNFKYFVNERDGKKVVSKVAKIYREGENAVAALFKLALPLIGKPEDEISDAEFYNFLIGKKVKIETKKGTYNKKAWFRNDIVAFV